MSVWPRYAVMPTSCRNVMPERHADETGNSAMSWWHIRRRKCVHRECGKYNFSQRACMLPVHPTWYNAQYEIRKCDADAKTAKTESNSLAYHYRKRHGIDTLP